MYYLQSRYYDPELQRFVCSDAYASTGQGIVGNNMFAYCFNNPINFQDSDGNNTEALKWWASAGWVFSIADGLLPIGDAIYALGLIGLSLFCSTTLTASQAVPSTEVTVDTTVQNSDEDDERIYSVYFLYAAGDLDKSIVYVGRVKTENFASRMSYHKTKDRLLVDSIDGLTYKECRAFEQAGMLYHHTLGKGQPYKNQINGIGPRNKNAPKYWQATYDLISKNKYPGSSLLPTSYLLNQAENEWLNSFA